MLRKKYKVLVLAGGPSSEHEVSLASGRNVFMNLNPKKYGRALFIIPKIGDPDKSVRMAVKKYYPDIVFLALHGFYGEDGRIQKLLDKIGFSYTGSGAAASKIAIDKLKSVRLFKKHGFLIPKTLNLKRIARFPIVIKPLDAGSSMGVNLVNRPHELFAAMKSARGVSRRAIAQEYIEGREITCGVLENPKTGQSLALPPTEIIPVAGKFFDYHSKYIKGASREITPARFPPKIIKAIQKNALIAHKILGCRGMSRTDMIIKSKVKNQKSKIYVLETNTIPGMTKTSLLPQEAKVAGISFPKLLDMLITTSLRAE